MVLHHRDDGTANRDGGTIQGMRQMRPFLPFDSVTNIQPPGLVVGAIGSAGNLTPLPTRSTPRHPRLQVVLAIRRTTEIPSGRINNPVRNLQQIE